MRLTIFSLAVILTFVQIRSTADQFYVANQDSDTVTIVDVTTFGVVATLPVGDFPHNVNHTSDGRFVLVTNKNINVPEPASMSIVSVADSEVVATVENLGERIEHVVSVPDNFACVTEDLGENAVLFVNLATRAIAARVAVGVKPHGLWPTSDGAFLFVPNQLSGTVTKIDVRRRAIVAEAVVGRTPTMVVVSPDDSVVYVTLYGERAVAIVDATKVESGRLQVNDVIPVGERPAQVAVTPDGRFALVPCEGPGALYVLDAQTRSVAAAVPTGRGAHGVDVSPDGKRAYVSNMADNTVSVVDLEQLAVVKQIEVGDHPMGIDYVETAGR